MTEESKIAPLAYENQGFLKSPDGRVLRIMSEYMEPLARFRPAHALQARCSNHWEVAQTSTMAA